MTKEEFEAIQDCLYQGDGEVCHVLLESDRYGEVRLSFKDGPFKGCSLRIEETSLEKV